MLGEKLKELRIINDIKQTELAKILGVSSSTIGMYEQGRRFPDLETLKKIADYFDVSADYLLGRTDIKKIEDLPEEVQRVSKLFASVSGEKSEVLQELLIKLLEKE